MSHESSEPYLNIYGQHSWHDEACIVGNTSGLTALKRAIESALDVSGAETEIFASDGEGFIFKVTCEDDIDAMPSPLYHCESVWEAEQRSTAELATLRARAERAEAGIVKANSQAEEFERRYYLEKNALEAAQSTIAELTGQVERQIGALRTAVLALAHANTEMAPGLYDKAYNAVSDELARAALGGEKPTAPAFTLPPETPPPE